MEYCLRPIAHTKNKRVSGRSARFRLIGISMAALLATIAQAAGAKASTVKRAADDHSPQASRSATVEHFWSSGISLRTDKGMVPGSSEMDPKDEKFCNEVASRLRGQIIRPSFDSNGISILPASLGSEAWHPSDRTLYGSVGASPCAAGSERGQATHCETVFDTEVDSSDGKRELVLMLIDRRIAGSNGPIPDFYIRESKSSRPVKGSSDVASPRPIMISGQKLVAGWGDRQVTFDDVGETPRALSRPRVTIDVGKLGPRNVPLIAKICEVSF